MKTSPTIDRTIFNEFNLPISKIYTNIEDNKNRQNKLQQFKLSTTPKTTSQIIHTSAPSKRILSLRFKKQIKWIHRHRRQTVLSRISQILSVGLHPNYYWHFPCSLCSWLSFKQGVSNPHQSTSITFTRWSLKNLFCSMLSISIHHLKTCYFEF